MFSLFHKKNETLVRRMSAAKTLGLVLGLLGGVILPPYYFLAPLPSLLSWGVVLWGITFGAIIGLAGLITTCPLFGKKCSLSKSNFWRPIFRGGVVGAWLELVLALLMSDKMIEMFASSNVSWVTDSNIFFLALAEGFVLGAIVDVIATKFGGDGKDIL